MSPQQHVLEIYEPYDYTGMSLVAHREIAAGFDSLEDFNRPEVTLAARLGGTPVEAARSQSTLLAIMAIQRKEIGRSDGTLNRLEGTTSNLSI